ncbi:telomere maintenance protein [Malassezia pachydermatis]
MISEVPGSAMAPAAQVAAQSMEPHIQMPKSHPIAATLTFGQPGTSQHACLSLPVRLWKATAHQRPPSTTRLAKGEAPASERRVEAHPLLYKVEDILQAGDDLHHVQPLPDTTPVQRAYKLGASLVPLHHTLPPLDTTPAMEILHFVHAKTYRREYHLGETYYVTAPTTSTRAQVALSSLVQAAAVKGVYALCRWVPRAQAEPKLYILAPLVESEYDGFYMVRVRMHPLTA